MANSSEESVNATLSSPLTFSRCLYENPFRFIGLYAVKLVCAILGTVSHLWCVRFYLRGPQCKFTPTHVFFLNYSIIELIYCLEIGPEVLNAYVFRNYKVSKVLFFFFGIAWTGRALVQTCICIEQYLAVLHPVTFLHYKDIKYRIAVVAAAWFTAILYGLHTINIQTFPDSVFNFVFFMSVTVIMFCCVSVLYALKQSHKHTSSQTGRCAENQRTKNVFNTIFSALLIILLTYFPQVLLSFLSVVKMDEEMYHCTVRPLIISLNCWSVVITPLLRMYKEGYLKLNGVTCRSVK